MAEYPEDELIASLHRAFIVHGADYVIIDSRRQQFLLASAQFGMDRGWLTFEEHEIDEQSTQWRYRLTDTGRAALARSTEGGT